MIAYILKVTLCWLFFFGIYELFLKKRTFFIANRTYLLATLLAGILLPLLEFIPWKTESNMAYVIYPVLMEIDDLQMIASSQSKESFNWMNVLYFIYAIGVIVSLVRLALGISRIVELYHASEKIDNKGFTLLMTNRMHLPFSFFKWVFLSKKMELSEDIEQVMEHEIEHVKGRHSIDVLLTEFLKVIFWCSPMIYFYKNALREVHEFLADHIVVESSDKVSYKKLLLMQTNNSLQLALTHQFFNSHLRNRLKMINQKRSGRPTLVMYALGIPVLLLLLFAFTNSVKEIENPQAKESLVKSQLLEISDASNWSPQIAKAVDQNIQDRKKDILNLGSDTIPGQLQKNYEVIGEVFKVVEQMPRFPGCEDIERSNKEKDACAKQKMLEYIYTQVKYPKEAKDKGIEGMTVVRFVVTKDGEIADTKLLREIGGGTGEEALRAVREMQNMPNRWVPGMQKGKAVNVAYTLPIRFKLANEDQPKDDIDVLPGKGNKTDDFKMDGKAAELGDKDEIHVEADKILLKNVNDEARRLYITLDGKHFERSLDDIDPENIASVSVLKGDKAIQRYGENGRNGVVEVVTKTHSESLKSNISADKINYSDGPILLKSAISDLDNQPLFVIDGEESAIGSDNELDPDVIAGINVLKGEAAEKKYGDKGLNGVIEITTKKGKIEKTKQGVFDANDVDQMAFFPGCGDLSDLAERKQCSNQKLLNFIYTNLKYPKEASRKGIEGTVVTSFNITTEGRVNKINLKRGVDGLSEEALRVVSLMDEQNIIWEPALMAGKPVDMEFVLPIKYKLSDECADCPKKVVSKYNNCDDLTDKAARENCRIESEREVKEALEKAFGDFDQLQIKEFAAFPNPAKDFVNLKFQANKSPIEIQLYDIDGRVIYDEQISDFRGYYEGEITLNEVSSKVVILRIQQDGKVFSEKIMVE